MAIHYAHIHVHVVEFVDYMYVAILWAVPWSLHFAQPKQLNQSSFNFIRIKWHETEPRVYVLYMRRIYIHNHQRVT